MLYPRRHQLSLHLLAVAAVKSTAPTMVAYQSSDGMPPINIFDFSQASGVLRRVWDDQARERLRRRPFVSVEAFNNAWHSYNPAWCLDHMPKPQVKLIPKGI